MERIELKDVNNSARREKMFAAAAAKLLGKIEYKAMGSEYKGELARSDKEMKKTEEAKQKIIDEWSTKVHEGKIKRAVKENENDSDELDAEVYAEKILSGRERRAKNKKHYSDWLTKGQRMRKKKSRKYRRR
jgi:hypothetical protein